MQYILALNSNSCRMVALSAAACSRPLSFDVSLSMADENGFFFVDATLSFQFLQGSGSVRRLVVLRDRSERRQFSYTNLFRDYAS
jgi:hypothetical protein